MVSSMSIPSPETSTMIYGFMISKRIPRPENHESCLILNITFGFPETFMGIIRIS